METTMTDKIVEQVIDKFKARSSKGIEKYGTTLEKNDLPLDEWLNHAQEEAMDFVVYLEKIKNMLKEQKNIEDFVERAREDGFQRFLNNLGKSREKK
jgi:hypothetical protein